VDDPANATERDRLQLHLVLPYKFQVGDHPRVRAYLGRGYSIVGLQRVTDREVLVTLAVKG